MDIVDQLPGVPEAFFVVMRPYFSTAKIRRPVNSTGTAGYAL